MMTKTAETRNEISKPPGNRAARGVKRGGDAQTRRNAPATRAANSTESLLSLKQELEAVRREHGKLQQAIYEAAQVQRRLCAPREMVWGDFEIAGESFPVRHLSGDFFKVMELGSELGLALGDIAGKGLSAGIWQAHLMDLIQRCARNYLHPADAIAGVNRELCQDRGEPPITALFFGRLDAERNELVYCNAGLPAPVLMRRDKSMERLEEGGPMLGALARSDLQRGNGAHGPRRHVAGVFRRADRMPQSARRGIRNGAVVGGGESDQRRERQPGALLHAGGGAGFRRFVPAERRLDAAGDSPLRNRV